MFEVWINMNQNTQVLVIGDIILDKYINGYYIKRVDDEGNRIFLEQKIIYRAGGAGNVACNIAQSKIVTTLLGMLGADADSQCCHSILEQYSVDTSMLIKDYSWTIPIVNRYIDRDKQIFRSDKKGDIKIKEYTESAIIELLKRNIHKFNSIIIVDYQKGLLSINLVRKIMKFAAQYKKRIIVDTKSKCLCPFIGSYLIKMNHKELQLATGILCNSLENIQRAAFQIIEEFQCHYFLTTWGENGIVLSSNNEFSLYIENLSKSPPICTIGAGDTVTAYLLIGIENNLTIEQCMILANAAAEAAVYRPMTTVLQDPFPDIQLLRKKVNCRYINRDKGTQYEKNSTWNQHWT